MSSLRLQSVLAEEELEAIDSAAIKILKDVGVSVPHSEVLDALSRHSGIEVNGEIVRFEPSLVIKNIQDTEGCKEYFTPVIAGAYCPNYLDADTDKPR